MGTSTIKEIVKYVHRDRQGMDAWFRLCVLTFIYLSGWAPGVVCFS